MNGKSIAALVSKVPNLEDRSRVIDELLRRTLRVGDPNNPVEVATALRQRYGEAAAKLDEEATGLPVTGLAPSAYLLTAPSAPADSPGEREYRRVQGALEMDLTALVNAPANRDYSAELTGWRGAILRQFGDGADAARTGPDPAKRQTAFLAVRTLGDYARVARLVGVLNLEMNPAFRRLARSIDDAASAIRVLTGEALYDAGLGNGGVLLDIPLVDLRQRGDALVQALRVLTALDNDDADDYGAALASYGALLDEIDHEGALELKVYLRESSLSLALDSIFDDLSSAVQRSDAEALRQIGGTLPVRIAELRRLYEIAVRAIGKKRHSDDNKDHHDSAVNSSAVSRFIRALDLFIQPLSQQRAGARLVDLAVPLAIVAGQAAEDSSARTLRDLVNARAALAHRADCFRACFGSEVEALFRQVQLDFVLYHVDRAIDLYADGQDYPGSGSRNHRAIACGVIAKTLSMKISDMTLPSDPSGALKKTRKQIVDTLDNIATTLGPDETKASNPVMKASNRVMKEMYLADVTWGQSAELMAPRYLRGNPCGHMLVRAALELLEQSHPTLATLAKKVDDSEPWDYQLSKFRVEPPEVSMALALEKIANAFAPQQVQLRSEEGKAPTPTPVQPNSPPPPPAAIGMAAVATGRTAIDPPVAAPAARLDRKQRDALLFLLYLTSRALDDVAQHLPQDHGEKQARRAWNRWLAVLRDGHDIHEEHEHVKAEVLGWMEGDPGRRLHDVIHLIDDNLGTDLDTIFDVGSREAEMNATVLIAKQNALDDVIRRVSDFKPTPEVKP